MWEWNILLLSALYFNVMVVPVWYDSWYDSYLLAVECDAESDGHGIRVAAPRKLLQNIQSVLELSSSHTWRSGRYRVWVRGRDRQRSWRGVSRVGTGTQFFSLLGLNRLRRIELLIFWIIILSWMIIRISSSTLLISSVRCMLKRTRLDPPWT